jgi:uncharacterized protein (TIGR03083 family)
VLAPQTYVAALRRDGEALAALANGTLDRPVPSCPGWSVEDLVRHVGQVHRHKLAIIDVGGTARPDVPWPPDAPEGSALIAWYRDGLEQLAARLETTAPETPAYSWAGDHRVAFWQRRMAQETLVHRWDGDDAVGNPGPLDAALAADGIDEYLTAFLPDPDFPVADHRGTVTITSIDTHDTWWVDTRHWPPDVRRGELPADVLAAGTAEQLLLVLWRRRPPSTVSVTGDDAVLAAMLAAADL